jgi:two-component system sensor histidine kinase VicK
MFRGLPPMRVTIGQGVAGWVALTGQPAMVNSAYSDERFFAEFDRASGFHTDSILCVPLKVEQRVIGVLEALNKRKGIFDESDQRFLQAVSGPLAVALANAQLHFDVLSEKRRIESIVTSMSEGLLATDENGVITMCNDALRSLLRRPDGEIVGLRFDSIIETRPASFGEFWSGVAAGGADSPQLACDLLQSDGDLVPVLISGAVVAAASVGVEEIIFVFSDLRQIREFERMRDDLFHNIVHELRTPLAIVLMYARLLQEGAISAEADKAVRFLGIIERESDRLQKMVRQMLQLAKFESAEQQRSFGPTDVNPVLEQLLPPLADKAAEKGVAIRQHVAPDLPPVLSNNETLHLVMKNLVDNAIQFTVKGIVTIEAKPEGEGVGFLIADQGIGITRAALPNLFQRFFRAETAVERGIAGTGLGLYMVKQAVDEMGGRIEVSSQVGKGTQFKLWLPAAPSNSILTEG